jgi:hypothetical protein
VRAQAQGEVVVGVGAFGHWIFLLNNYLNQAFSKEATLYRSDTYFFEI